MKHAAYEPPRYDSGPNMTPLVDVVMVILIFLMLAGSFGSDEHYMVSKTPTHLWGPGRTRVSLPEVSTQTIEVLVRGDGTFSLPPRQDGGREWLVRPADFRTRLEGMSGEFAAAGVLDDVEIVLRPTADAKWQTIAPLYAAALQANYNKVAFAMVGAR